MSSIRTIDELDLKGKRAIVRVDLNVPVENGQVRDRTRIERIVPTLRDILSRGASIILLAHFDRPKGKVVPQMSLAPIAPAVADALGRPVVFVSTDWRDDAAARGAAALRPGQVMLAENTRFHPGEEDNDPLFARMLAALGDVYINDAFSAAHRAHASTEAIAHELPSAAGRAMQAELSALERALVHAERPAAAMVGGAKISTKLDLLGNLIDKLDTLIIGGGMANTFLAAQGVDVGKSLCERDLLDTARKVLETAASRNCRIILPPDAMVAEELKPGAAAHVTPVGHIRSNEMILDIGPESVEAINAALSRSLTLVWNGPLGAFEVEPFDRGTIAVARHVASLTRSGKLVSIAGGGDTVAALNKAGVASAFTYVSTAGGAFLEWLEGKPLPGVKVLER